MPVTYTGRIIRPYPRESDVLSLLDIAVGLSRQPRFAGQTRRWWSVLDHVLHADFLAQHGNYGSDVDMKKLRVAVLLHDAHEAATADVPTDFKTAGLRDSQSALDGQIYPRYAPGLYCDQKLCEPYAELTHLIDHRALMSEAQIVGPPIPLDETKRLFGEGPTTPNDCAILRNLITENPKLIGVPPFVELQEQHPTVKLYIETLSRLL